MKVEREQHSLAKEESSAHENMRFLPGMDRGRTVPISLEEITTIEAANEFSVVHTLRGSFMVRTTLVRLEKLLQGGVFYRIKHSLILNIRQIEVLQILGAHGNHLRMKDGRVVALTLQLSELEGLLRHESN